MRRRAKSTAARGTSPGHWPGESQNQHPSRAGDYRPPGSPTLARRTPRRTSAPADLRAPGSRRARPAPGRTRAKSSSSRRVSGHGMFPTGSTSVRLRAMTSKPPARPNHASDRPGARRARLALEDLDRVGLEDEIERRQPLVRGPERVRDLVSDERLGKAAAAPGHGRRRDIEGCDLEAAVGQELGIVAVATTDDQGATPRQSGLPPEPRDQIWIGGEVDP